MADETTTEQNAFDELAEAMRQYEAAKIMVQAKAARYAVVAHAARQETETGKPARRGGRRKVNKVNEVPSSEIRVNCDSCGQTVAGRKRGLGFQALEHQDPDGILCQGSDKRAAKAT